MSFSNKYLNLTEPNNTSPNASYTQNYQTNVNIPPPFTPSAQNYCRPLMYQQSDPRFKSLSQQNDPRFKSLSASLIAENLAQKSDDELFIETFLSKTGKINLNLHSNAEIITKKPLKSTPNKKTLKIHVAKSVLHRCIKLITQLEKLEAYLKENVAIISTTEWKEKTIEIGQQKDEFTALLTQFEDSNILEQLRKNLAKRKKKRISQKHKKISNREEVAEMHKNRKMLHKSIDQWLENMKDDVERAKREEYLKKDADCVLSEVTKKKSDARKQLSLLSSLVKLRSVREKVALARGEKISLEDSNAFKLNSERLQKMWENALKVYGIEEHGLRVMLEQTAADEKRTKASEERRMIIQQWEALLFGAKVVPCEAYWGLTCAEKDFGTFMAIRKSWDTFLVPENNETGSRIPIGWILPQPPKSELDPWSLFLHKDNSA